MDEAPLTLTCHGVLIGAAQESHIVGLHQLLHRGRIAAELAKVEVDGPHVLAPPEQKFLFEFALAHPQSIGNRGAQGDEQESGKHQQDQQHVAALALPAPLASSVPLRE